MRLVSGAPGTFAPISRNEHILLMTLGLFLQVLDSLTPKVSVVDASVGSFVNGF